MSEAIAGLPPPPPPAAPRDAVVVVLYRRVGEGVELFWLKREKSLRFGGGFYAYPGGRVDQADGTVPVVGAEGEAARLVVCAARELFEETGVLMARGALPSGEELAAGRRALLEEREGFGALLARWGLGLEAGDWTPAGRWVTPPTMGLRFDARFFLLELPGGQGASVWPGELELGEWVTPEAALGAWERAQALLHPPTLHVLRVLSRFVDRRSAAEAMAHPAQLDSAFITNRVEFQRGVFLFPLATPTLPPAAHTNCWLLGTGELLVVDPGSPDDAETERLVGFLEGLRAEGCAPKAIVATHHHFDHVGGVGYLARRLGVPVWAHARTADRLAVPVERLLADGDVLELAGPLPMRWQVLHTPGHARGHLTLVDERTRSAVVGDMVAGVGTIVIDPPEGEMGEYLRQLERLKPLVGVVYPAHGPPIPEGPAKLEEYLVHRRWREQKVRAALEQLGRPASVEEVVSHAYDDVQAFVWPLAERNTVAILEQLLAEGVAVLKEGRWTLAR